MSKNKKQQNSTTALVNSVSDKTVELATTSKVSLMPSNHTRKFKRDNKNLKLVRLSEYKDLLEWAHKKKYIRLRKFEGQQYYDNQQLEIAKMWREKDND